MVDDVQRDGEEWPERPWIMAGIGAVAGFLFYLLVDDLSYQRPISATVLLRQALAAGVGVSALSFLITAQKSRWSWAIAFSLVWGLVIALVGYSTGAYSRSGEVMGFPFLSGLLAVGIAAPLFQTMRDEGRRALPYEKVHRYAWTDAIIGGASLAFTGLTFAVAFLLSALFDAIGIPLIKDLLNHGLFNFAMAGAAFGAASAILRQRDPLLGTLQRLVMMVFAVLAPVLAFALAVYLLALPVTGFSGLWKSGLPETPLLLSAAGAAFVFLNAVIGDSSDDRGRGTMWRLTEVILLVAVLPLGVLALVSMGMRVGQYGWTPERLWGVTACLIAIAYGLSNWVALARGRQRFDEQVRTHQKWLAVSLCGLALFLALPIVDFGSISTRSQLSRLEAGKVSLKDFDWKALAFDFGPAGRRALTGIAARGAEAQRPLAREALKATNRYDVEEAVETRLAVEDLDQRLKIVAGTGPLEPALRDLVAKDPACQSGGCALLFDKDGAAFLVGHRYGPRQLEVTRFVRLPKGGWTDDPMTPGEWPENSADPHRAPVEIRDVKRRQVFVDGKPVGIAFE